MQLAISRLHSFYSNATLLSQPAGAQWEPWLQGAALVKQAFAVAISDPPFFEQPLSACLGAEDTVVGFPEHLARRPECAN
jgi:hypothetical protein